MEVYLLEEAAAAFGHARQQFFGDVQREGLSALAAAHPTGLEVVVEGVGLLPGPRAPLDFPLGLGQRRTFSEAVVGSAPLQQEVD
jgi:hypothetical protein